MEFKEFPEFTRKIIKIVSDEGYQELQNELIKNPSRGDLVPGTSGARKIRMGVEGRGKRGGARVYYYFHDSNNVFWMFKAFLKNEMADLSEIEKREIRNVIQEIKRSTK